MSLADQISRIQKLLIESDFPNEASISNGIVLPILEEVGWNIHDPRFVMPEYSVSGTRVDFALFDRRKRPLIFIEVKMLGKIDFNSNEAEEQLFRYAFHQGVPFLILTDGKEWNFFLPLETGSYQDRKLYKLDLLERDQEVIIEKFKRYLSYADVISGTALENAKEDLKKITNIREAKSTIPEAWEQLIRSHDEILLELLSDKVEGICGFKPDENDCIHFLESRYQILIEDSPKPRGREIQDSTNSINNRNIFVTIDGKTEYCHSAREVMIKIITYLAKRDSTFLDSFQKIAHGEKRHYISRNKMDLYPGRPDIADKASREFLPGWWIGLNYSKRSIDDIIKLALHHAGLKKGSFIDYKLG